ncbi:MAG: hypothetical protein ACRDHW_15425, partial [Ktedonobacteraceae bacterium]
MQNDQDNSARFSTRPRLARTRFVELNSGQHTTGPLSTTGDLNADPASSSVGQTGYTTQKRASQTLRLSLHEDGPASLQERSTAYLMQLSGMLRPLHAANATQDVVEAEEDGY